MLGRMHILSLSVYHFTIISSQLSRKYFYPTVKSPCQQHFYRSHMLTIVHFCVCHGIDSNVAIIVRRTRKYVTGVKLPFSRKIKLLMSSILMSQSICRKQMINFIRISSKTFCATPTESCSALINVSDFSGGTRLEL